MKHTRRLDDKPTRLKAVPESVRGPEISPILKHALGERRVGRVLWLKVM